MQSTTSAGDLIATTDDVIDVVDALSMPSPRRRGGRDAREQGPASGRSSREHETGISPAEACRRHGIPHGTLGYWSFACAAPYERGKPAADRSLRQ